MSHHMTGVYIEDGDGGGGGDYVPWAAEARWRRRGGRLLRAAMAEAAGREAFRREAAAAGAELVRVQLRRGRHGPAAGARRRCSATSATLKAPPPRRSDASSRPCGRLPGFESPDLERRQSAGLALGGIRTRDLAVFVVLIFKLCAAPRRYLRRYVGLPAFYAPLGPMP